MTGGWLGGGGVGCGLACFLRGVDWLGGLLGGGLLDVGLGKLLAGWMLGGGLPFFALLERPDCAAYYY